MRPKYITTPVLTNDLNGICIDQTTGAAASLDLDGVLVTGGVATAAAAQIVSIEGAGDNTLVIFTITGTDADGKVQSEALAAGPNNTTVISIYYYLTVTSIAADAAITGDVQAGWMATDGMATKTIPLDYVQNNFAVTMGSTEVVGGQTITGQYALENPYDYGNLPFAQTAIWRTVTGMSAVTVNTDANIAFPVMAVRFIQTIGTTTATNRFTVLQGGGI